MNLILFVFVDTAALDNDLIIGTISSPFKCVNVLSNTSFLYYDSKSYSTSIVYSSSHFIKKLKIYHTIYDLPTYDINFKLCRILSFLEQIAPNMIHSFLSQTHAKKI